MSLEPQQLAELHDLLWELRSGTAAPEQLSHLERMVCEDPQVREFYVRYMHLCADLHWNGIEEKAEGGKEEVNLPSPVPLPPSVNLPSAFPLPPSCPSHPSHSSLSSLLSLDTPLGSFLFSYGVSAVLVGILILTFSMMNAGHPEAKNFATDGSSPSERVKHERAPEPEIVMVGQITGMVDCTFSDDHFAPAHDRVALGAKYMLASGLMEITYKTGARVILQGPCTYTAESAAGGYLSLGKLTARVEKKAEGGRRKAEAANLPSPSGRGAGGEGSAKSPDHSALTLALSQGARGPDQSSVSLPPSPLFPVRTPTAIVTDLGTEFGVDVDPSGSCQTCVFQGKVELRTTNSGKEGSRTIQLGKNESAQTISVNDRAVTVICETGRSKVYDFQRRMPERVKIALFNTGVGLREGDEDAHWQFSARSDDPGFKPRPAVVTKVYEHYCLANNPAESQWISAVADLSPLPDSVIYTFRTTFQLNGTLPGTAIVHGRFLADDHVAAIRLNGRSVKVPDHPWGWPFTRWAEFTVSEGFVQEQNVLEVDLLNKDPSSAPENTKADGPLSLRVELNGTVQRVPPPATEETFAGKEVAS